MRLRVLTLNVLNLEGDPRRQELINAELRRLRPDLVSFQEVIQEPGREQLAQLLDGTGLHGTHQADTLGYALTWADRFGGGAVATRWPHRVLETLDLRCKDSEVHPWATLAVVVDLPEEGELLFIGTTTCASFGGEVARERHVVALTELDARHRRTLPTIIAGDFNADPTASSIRFLTGLQPLDGRSVFYHDAWEVAGAGPGHTFTDENPTAGALFDKILRQPGYRRRIDYVFVGSAEAHPAGRASVERAELVCDRPIDGIWPSDHYGVLVELEVGGATPWSPDA